jgi:hypothetical protein
MDLDARFRQYKLNAYLPEDTIVTPTIEVKSQETLKAIEPTITEQGLTAAGVTLADIGDALDSLGKINIKGVEIGLRDLLPFVGYTEDGQQKGTPAALQAAGRGERLIKGGSLQTATLTPDAQALVADVATAGVAMPVARAVKKGMGKLITKASK